MNLNQFGRQRRTPFLRFTIGAIGWCVLCGSVVIHLGCSGGRNQNLVPVSGLVIIDGEPAENILLQFMPDKLAGTDGPTSTGTTGSDGQFTLRVDEKYEGAVEGMHIVTIFDLDEERPEQGQEQVNPSRVHSKFGTYAGGLRIEVKAGNPIEINFDDIVIPN